MSPICEWLSRLETLGASPPSISSFGLVRRASTWRIVLAHHATPSAHNVASPPEQIRSPPRTALQKGERLPPTPSPYFQMQRHSQSGSRGANAPVMGDSPLPERVSHCAVVSPRAPAREVIGQLCQQVIRCPVASAKTHLLQQCGPLPQPE
jgi:hypothetical protein